MKVGYIGIGLMGFPCCKNLLAKGFSVSIWTRNHNKALPLIDLGAIWCDSPKKLAGEVDILFLNVSNTNDVEEILFSQKGVAASKKAGLIVVDMSTISATATVRFAKRLESDGIELVDAPVSGGTVGAQNGTLTFMVGASEATLQRLQPLFSAMGNTITRIGNVGSGQIAKSCNQIVITGAIEAVTEAFRFAKANGVNLEAVRAALLGGLAQSKVLEIHGKRIIDDTFPPGFKTNLHLKDMRIVKEVAEEKKLYVPLTDMGIRLLEKAVAAGHSNEDSAVIAKFYE